MPQLAPAPWLAFSVTAWFVLLVLMAAKTSMNLLPSNPISPGKESLKTTTWNWPWH
uniref:ATP synthase complex subunit 8 n=1 Tax=Oxymonacanthus longirostris TaxID=303724 RepID=B7ZHP1_9TELE|nr:ATP synthase F0 subunit 8 [Oxymonacanthus longirostris]BAH10412.1 ATPase subunit 8 [Oxymonacanthus longirostris]